MPLLELEQLQKAYTDPDGNRSVVLDVPHFAMEERQQMGLAGTSGSGKTTLLNIVAGILKPTSGRVILAGKDLSELKERERDRLRATTIGYVFQTFQLLDGYSALENVLLGMMFGPGSDPEFAAELLKKLGLGNRLRYRPRQLSIGQQQRVAVARALANRPKLVLADEPTGNLDPHFAQEALRLLRDLCKDYGAALLLVSHDVAILKQFDQVQQLSELNRAVEGAGS